MVLDEGKGSCSEDVVVGTLYLPVEVGQPELVIDYRTVAHAEGCPGGQFALVQVACQNLGGSWAETGIPKCTWEEHKPQKTAMDDSQNSCHCPGVLKSLQRRTDARAQLSVFSLHISLTAQVSQHLYSNTDSIVRHPQ